MTGTIPNSIGKLINIKDLYLYRNHLTGKTGNTWFESKCIEWHNL